MEVNLSQNYRDKGDAVSYKAIGRDGKERVWDRTSCFSGVMSDLGGYEIHCRPWNGQNSAPSLIYQRFFRELIRFGVVPQGVRAGTQGGQNILVIPRRGWDDHTVFVALSMYRHADCHGKSIVGQTMTLYDRLGKTGVHWLQCLHWAFCHTDYGTWHSCINLTSNPSPYYGDDVEPRTKNLKWGLALAAFGKITPTKRKEELAKENQTTLMFDTLARKLKNIRLDHVDGILDPQYAQYYENPELARK